MGPNAREGDFKRETLSKIETWAPILGFKNQVIEGEVLCIREGLLWNSPR